MDEIEKANAHLASLGYAPDEAFVAPLRGRATLKGSLVERVMFDPYFIHAAVRHFPSRDELMQPEEQTERD